MVIVAQREDRAGAFTKMALPTDIIDSVLQR
jgi:hypothetical protein